MLFFQEKCILNYVNKVVADNEPKLENLKIIQDNINNKKPTYRKEVDPETLGKAAARVEKARQMSGSEMSTWDMLKKAANTPAEKKEIRKIISEDYKKNGPKDMDQDDLAWIGRGTLNPMKIKIDVEGHEFKVLKGAKETLLKHKPIVFLECFLKSSRTENAGKAG